MKRVLIATTIIVSVSTLGCSNQTQNPNWPGESQNPGYSVPPPQYDQRWPHRPPVPHPHAYPPYDNPYPENRPPQDMRPPYDQRQEQRQFTQELYSLHNEERDLLGLPKLKLDQDLNQVALDHARWMADNQRLTHTGDDNSTVYDRVGRSHRHVGENLAMGYYDPTEAMDDWMGSYGHRRNILRREYTHVGFGVAYAEDGTTYWCVVFAGP